MHTIERQEDQLTNIDNLLELLKKIHEHVYKSNEDKELNKIYPPIIVKSSCLPKDSSIVSEMQSPDVTYPSRNTEFIQLPSGESDSSGILNEIFGST